LKNRSWVIFFSCLWFLSAWTANAAVSAETKGGGNTLKNLMTAYSRESNDQVQYSSFAQKAEGEGFRGTASLFKAVVKSKEILMAGHAALIRELGGVPRVNLTVPAPKSTKENVAASLKNETDKSTRMYPGFVREAETEKNSAAFRSLTFAKVTDAQHAAFFGKTLENLNDWKASGGKFYVCPVCGYTAQSLTGKVCPVCSTPSEKAIVIS
jgi:rubrerythrin